MNSFVFGAGPAWLNFIGQALIHSLWQGALVAAGYAWARRLLRNGPVQKRYAAGCVAMLLLGLIPVLTLALLQQRLSTAAVGVSIPPVATRVANAPEAKVEPSTAELRKSEPEKGWMKSVPSIVAALWLLGVAVFGLRLAAGAWQLRRIRLQSCRAIGAEWQAAFRRVCDRMGVRRVVELLECDRVDVPAVAGWIRPAILVPPATLCGLSTQQFEAILAHELAHILRHDALVNLVQRVLEVAWFHHPAVWWIGACLREDRELCCDEWAVQVCGDRVGYAEALVSLESMRGEGLALAMGAAGGSLRNRVMWLLGRGAGGERSFWKPLVLLLGTGVVAMVLLVSAGGWGGRLYEATSRVRIEPGRNVARNSDGVEAAYDPYWVQLEMHVILGDPVLEKVVDSLRLAEEFGGRAGLGSTPARNEVVRVLRKRVRVSQYRNTHLFSVSARAEKPDRAAELANGIVKAYREFRLESNDAAERELAVSYEKSRAVASELQAVIEKKMEAHGLLPLGAPGTNLVDWEAVRTCQREITALGMKIERGERQLREYADMPMPLRTRAISAAPVTDPLLMKLLQDQHAAEQARASMRTDNSKLLETINGQITDRVAAWMEAREAELRHDRMQSDAWMARLRKLEAQSRAAGELAAERLDLDHARERAAWLRSNLEAERERRRSQAPVVDVIDLASPPLRAKFFLF